MLLVSGKVTASAEERYPAATCSYEMQVWNVNLKSSVQLNLIRHAYAELRVEESDPITGCTVCSEDQERIEIPPLAPFSVCRKIAPRVRNALSSLVQNGGPVHTVIGYHVIKSRGPVDGNGNRTGFSNHSFGTAIDINPEQNGLYDNCTRFGPQCRLLRGGEWRTGVPGTLERDGEIVRALKTAGFQWGGEIAGEQKDFMHFSLTGY
jgi:hypothetical protein